MANFEFHHKMKTNTAFVMIKVYFGRFDEREHVAIEESLNIDLDHIGQHILLRRFIYNTSNLKGVYVFKVNIMI